MKINLDTDISNIAYLEYMKNKCGKEEQKMNELSAQECYEYHKSAFGTWKEGNIKDVWLDNDGTLCVRYESGKWWHYKKNNTNIEYW